MATVLDIADAVVAALNGASLSQSFTAERLYVPVHGLADLAALRVTVVPAGLTLVTLSRRDDDFDYVIDVGIQKRVGGTTAAPKTDAAVRAAADAVMLLGEEVVDLFRAGGSVAGARFVGAANAPIFDPAHYDEDRVLTSLVTLTFRKARAR